MLEPFLTKSEIIRHGQPYCSSSFTVPVNGTHFTAWSSMNELIRRELVGKMCSPPKYYLTDEGVELAKKLSDVKEKLGSPNTSEIVNANRLQVLNKNKEKDLTESNMQNDNNVNKKSDNDNDRKILESPSVLQKKINYLNQTNLLNEIAKNLSLLNQNIQQNNILLQESEKDLPFSHHHSNNKLINETTRSLNHLLTNTIKSNESPIVSTVTNIHPQSSRYLINDDDDFETNDELNLNRSRLSYLNEKYTYVQINGKSMKYLDNHQNISSNTSELKLRKRSSSKEYTKEYKRQKSKTKKSTSINNNSNKSMKSSMYKSLTKPFLSKNNKGKGKEQDVGLTSFYYFYLNDDDDSVYDKNQASTKYGNNK